MKVAKMSGAGNTFAVANVQGLEADLSQLAKDLCQKLGADGFLGVETAENADIRLHFYNADGSRGEMCGNGARCVCKFAYDNGLAGESVTLQTDAGQVFGWRLGENAYRVQLNLPSVVDLQRTEDAAYIELGDPGVPHCVFRLDQLEFTQKKRLLPAFLVLRHKKEFPKGVNVNFYCLLGEGRARIVTFERGVEDFTLACGTGSASVAVVLWKQGLLPGNVLEAENEGGLLTVTVEETGGELSALFLEGPAETLEILEI